MRLFAVLCAAAMSMYSQPAPTLPLDQLSHIRARMLDNLSRQPNYTCVETVERSHRSGATRKFKLVDTLRLEVALVDGREMFGWPGANKFEDTELRHFVTTGAIGNGNFALHARAIFDGDAAQFEYRGIEPVDGTIRYDFRVPLLASAYKLRANNREAIVAYHGSFWADPVSLDIVRLEVGADEIPASLGLASTTDRMEYVRQRIGDRDFLLPASSELTMTDLDGSASRNEVHFAGCRQFTGSSVLTFGDEPAHAMAPVAEIVLPKALDLKLRLVDDIDVERAAVGDPVRARLENDLKHGGRVLIPKGATVTGRITRVERRGDYTEVGLTFSEIDAPGVHGSFNAELQNFVGPEPAELRPQSVFHRSRRGEGIIPLSTGRPRLLHGLLMFWRT